MADLKPLEIPLNGKLNIEIDGSQLTPADYVSLKNMRPTEAGIRGIQGQTKSNTTVTGDANGRRVVRGYHFKKDKPSESHVLVQVQRTDETDTEIYEQTAVVPAQGDFTDLNASPGAALGKFSKLPDGCVGFCNGTVNKVWGGDEYRCAGFINFDPNGTFKYDYTSKINNTINDANNVAVLKRIAGGVDSSTMLLLHLDNNVTDSSPTTAHTVTNNNVTFDTTKVFGTHAAVFNGTTAYLTIPDNADFDLSAGTFTIDLRARIGSLAAARPLYYQKTDVLSLAYTSGSEAPTVGSVLVGATSTSTAIVDYVPEPTTGSWAGTDAAGTIYVHTKSAPFVSENLNIQGGTANVMTIAADTSDAGDNYILLSVATTGAVSLVVHECYGAGSDVVSVSTPASTISINTWYHIEVVESASSWYIFIDGSVRGSATDASRARNYISIVYIGYDGTNYLSGRIDEYRVSNAARHTSDFAIPQNAYGTSTETHVFIRSTRTLQGAKWYVSTANTTAGTVTGYEWTGAAWSALASLVDGTLDAGTSTMSLGQTGSMTWTDTQSTSKVKILYEAMSYVYWFVFSGIDDDVSIYYCTLDANWQPFVDLWDGFYRTIGAFKYYTASDGSLADYTLEVKDDTYTASVTSTYINIGATPSTNIMYFGFAERMCGMVLRFIGGYENTNNAIATIEYYNGSDFVEVPIDDGTNNSGKTFGKGGVTSWSPLEENVEFTKELANDTPLYYYKVTVSATLSTNIYLYYVAGIPVQKQITGYKSITTWHDRPVLLNKSDTAKNRVLIGQYGTVCVFNGVDYWEYDIGDDTEITNGMPFFTRISGDLYESLLLTKNNESWIIDGTMPSNYRPYNVSRNYGNVASDTMQSCDIGIEIAPGINKNVLIWRSSSAIVMFDGSSILPIHSDIKKFFNKSYAYRADTTKLSTESSTYDPNEMEYHWLFTDVTGARRELVYSLSYRKWFEIDRTSTKRLMCIYQVEDTVGNKYIYGGDALGYTYRLEYGTAFDDQDMVYSFQKPDIFPAGSTLYETEIRNIQLIAVAKNTTTNDVSLTMYPNTITTGESKAAKGIDDSTHRLKVLKWSNSSGPALMHSLAFSLTTNDETIGFEPVHLSVMWQLARQSL